MIKTAAALMAAASMFASVAADAHCSCKPKRHKTVHRHHAKAKPVRRIVRVQETEIVAVPVVRKMVESSEYVTIDTAYLPDPERPGRIPWNASPAEAVAADALNATLDIWRTCGWSGYEQPAAAFVAWSRTHMAKDRIDPTYSQIAWKPYSRVSFGRTEALTDPIERSRYCAEVRPQRTELRADMERHMDTLARAHLASHRN